MPSLALPEGIDPKIRFVEFRVMECQTCGARGPAVNTDDKQNPDHLWDAEHADEFEALGQKHEKFWAWTLQRSHAETFRLPRKRTR